MFLFILEDGSMVQHSNFTDEDVQSVSNGILDIIYFDDTFYTFRQMDENGTFYDVDNF